MFPVNVHKTNRSNTTMALFHPLSLLLLSFIAKGSLSFQVAPRLAHRLARIGQNSQTIRFESRIDDGERDLVPARRRKRKYYDEDEEDDFVAYNSEADSSYYNQYDGEDDDDDDFVNDFAAANSWQLAEGEGEEYDIFANEIIPNPILDAIDPEGAAERFPELASDPRFWFDMFIFVCILDFVSAVGPGNPIPH